MPNGRRQRSTDENVSAALRSGYWRPQIIVQPELRAGQAVSAQTCLLDYTFHRENP